MEKLPSSKKEAERIESKFYFTNTPCKHRHVSKRYTRSGSCYECHKVHMRRHYDKNADKLKEYARKHYTNNHKYYLNWISENKERLAEYRTANRKRISETLKLYRKTNAAQFRAWNAKRRASELQATPNWFEVDVVARIYSDQQVLLEQGIECQVDHIMPLISDMVCGLHCKDNLILVPSHLNNVKNNKFYPKLGWGEVNLDILSRAVLEED